MKELFIQYLIDLYQSVPQEVYEGLLSVFCLGLVVFVAWKGLKTGFRYSAILLLVEYVFLLFCSTVIFRATGETRQYDFHPFWSYDRPDLLTENIMNVVAFVPVGFLLGSVTEKGKKGKVRFKKGWLVALLIGAGLSASIETLQFLFMRGFSEIDDVMHNTLGCVMGYGICSFMRLEVRGKKCVG